MKGGKIACYPLLYQLTLRKIASFTEYTLFWKKVYPFALQKIIYIYTMYFGFKTLYVGCCTSIGSSKLCLGLTKCTYLFQLDCSNLARGTVLFILWYRSGYIKLIV